MVTAWLGIGEREGSEKQSDIQINNTVWSVLLRVTEN